MTLVIVRAIISRCRNKQDAGITRCPYRVLKGLGILRRTPASADHTYIHTVLFTIDGVVNRLDRVGGRAVPTLAEELERHDLHIPIYTGNTLAIITLGTDDPGAMGTVTVVVHRIGDLVSTVIAVLVVKGTKFIVDISWYVIGAYPHIRSQIDVS